MTDAPAADAPPLGVCVHAPGTACRACLPPAPPPPPLFVPGWQCPSCGRCFAPFVPVCSGCVRRAFAGGTP